MSAIVKTVKISSKGQITLPKAVRERLASDLVQIIADDTGVRLQAASNPAGSLKEYAKEYVPLETVREILSAQVRKHGFRRP